MHVAPPRAHQAVQLPAAFVPAQCPVRLGPPDGPAANGQGTADCGLSASPWDLAQFEPVKPSGSLQWLASMLWGSDETPDAPLQASASLRGFGLLTPDKAQVRTDRLLTQGRSIQGILQHYAQARCDARLPGDAPWVAQLAQGRLPILLASPEEFRSLALEAIGSRPASGVVALPQGRGILVDAQSFFQQGTERPCARTLRALQASFIHPRCAALLELVARIGRFPKDQMDEALDQVVMGQAKAGTSQHLKAIMEVMIQGDEEAVARALFNPGVMPVVVASPMLPGVLHNATAAPESAADAMALELRDLAADALAYPNPRRHRTQALLGVLGKRSRATLANAFVRTDLAALQRVLTAYAVVVCNDATRSLLRPVVGELDALQDLGVQVQMNVAPAALSQQVGGGDLPLRLRGGELNVAVASHYDRETRMAGAAAAARRILGAPPVDTVPPGRGTLSRAQVAAATGRPEMVMQLASGDSPLASFEWQMVLPQVVAAYADGFAFGASQGTAKALDLKFNGEGVAFVEEYLCAYICHRFTGQLVHAHHGPGMTATRRVIEARAWLDNISFEQAEREVLGVMFRERSFGTEQDLRDLERLTRSLFEQRKLDILRGSSGTAAKGTLVNVIGGAVMTSPWVRVMGRHGNSYIVETASPLPAPPLRGVVPHGDGTLRVDADQLVSVVVPPGTADPATFKATGRGRPLAAAQSAS